MCAYKFLNGQLPGGQLLKLLLEPNVKNWTQSATVNPDIACEAISSKITCKI